MDAPTKTAVLLGATGLTGSLLLNGLLEDPRYSRVIVFSRSKVAVADPKLREYLIDLHDLSSFKTKFIGDEAYCCIGTTRAKTSDKEQYKRIDYGIPVMAARLCRENEINTFIVISSLGANPKSSLFYPRIKGEMEAEVIRTGIPKTHILRPSLIVGKRREIRIGEWVGKQVMRALHLVMAGSLKKFRSVVAADIATCMIWLANNPCDSVRIRSDEITFIARHHRTAPGKEKRQDD